VKLRGLFVSFLDFQWNLELFPYWKLHGRLHEVVDFGWVGGPRVCDGPSDVVMVLLTGVGRRICSMAQRLTVAAWGERGGCHVPHHGRRMVAVWGN
jgi:hypothetical protein